MKRLALLLVFTVMFGMTAYGQQFEKKGDQAKMLGMGVEVDTAKGGKLQTAVGAEKIYLAKDLCSVSFKKDKEHKVAANLMYSCMGCDKHQVRPGVCKCGQALLPSFKHGDTWHTLSRNAEGLLVIDGQPTAPAPAAEPAGCPPDCQKPCCAKTCAEPAKTCACPKCGGNCDPECLKKCQEEGKCCGKDGKCCKTPEPACEGGTCTAPSADK